MLTSANRDAIGENVPQPFSRGKKYRVQGLERPTPARSEPFADARAMARTDELKPWRRVYPCSYRRYNSIIKLKPPTPNLWKRTTVPNQPAPAFALGGADVPGNAARQVVPTENLMTRTTGVAARRLRPQGYSRRPGPVGALPPPIRPKAGFGARIHPTPQKKSPHGHRSWASSTTGESLIVNEHTHRAISPKFASVRR